MEGWERQALLDARTLDGKTALALATISGSVQIVSHLGACGATTGKADAVTRSTPVHWAGAALPHPTRACNFPPSPTIPPPRISHDNLRNLRPHRSCCSRSFSHAWG